MLRANAVAHLSAVEPTEPILSEAAVVDTFIRDFDAVEIDPGTDLADSGPVAPEPGPPTGNRGPFPEEFNSLNQLHEVLMEDSEAEDFQGFDRFSRNGTGPRAGGFGRIPHFPRTWPKPMAPDAFHGLTGRVVAVIEPHSEADVQALLLSFLAAAGNALGRGPYAPAEGDRHGTNLFIAIVGKTSKGRKGTSWRVHKVPAAADSAWLDRICGGLSSGEGLIWQVRDAITTRRRARTKDEREHADEDGYVTDTTDSGIDDKRLMVVESEMAGALRAMRRESNTLSAVLRNLWDRGEVASMTKNSPARTTGAHVSVIGHIVEDELKAELSATDSANGFANRYLWSCAERSKVLPEGGNLSPGELQPLANELAEAIEWCRQPRELVRDKEARELWSRVYGPLSEGQPGLFGAVTSRAEAQVLRLSVVYAALDRSDCIRVEHLRAALAVWRYCEDSARHIFGDKLGDKVADTIRQALREKPDGMTRSEIRDLFKRHETADHIDDALSLLINVGIAERKRIPTGGRPTELIRLCDRAKGDESAERSGEV